MFMPCPVTGSWMSRPSVFPIVIGCLQVRPPSADRSANSCVGSERTAFGSGFGSLLTRPNTLSREPSRFTRILPLEGQLFGVFGLYRILGVDQLRPPSVVVDSRL